jgi:hypothetical protein
MSGPAFGQGEAGGKGAAEAVAVNAEFVVRFVGVVTVVVMVVHW